MNANAPRFNPDAIDSNIDRALSALRDAQPRSGLNGRILTSLEHRTDTVGGPSFRAAKGWGVVFGSKQENARRTIRLALWTAAAAAVLAVASLIVLHHHATPIQFAQVPQAASANPTNADILSERSESKNPETASRTTDSEPLSTTSGAPPSTRTARQGGVGMHVQPIPSGLVADPKSPDTYEVSRTPTDTQALADLHAPSHPAPPAQLSSQEKLLLHMLRYGNATQLAELDPAVRAQRDADETAAFKAFFPDPPPVTQPGDTE